LEGLAAVEVLAVSEARWTKRYMFSTATPMTLLASEGENEVVDVDIGTVPVTESRPPLTVCPAIVHIPETVSRSPGGKRRSQPVVGV
jgi:hypothetical protein